MSNRQTAQFCERMIKHAFYDESSLVSQAGALSRATRTFYFMGLNEQIFSRSINLFNSISLYRSEAIEQMKIYIDTSVVGGFYDKEFDETTREFFKMVERGEIVLVVSDLLRAELLRAPEHVRKHLDKYSKKQTQQVELTEEAKVLADRYIAEKVVGATSKADCQHIAIATVNRVDVLVSWNFKHIVNLKRIRGYNSVNLKHNYPMLEIRTPKEILEL